MHVAMDDRGGDGSPQADPHRAAGAGVRQKRALKLGNLRPSRPCAGDAAVQHRRTVASGGAEPIGEGTMRKSNFALRLQSSLLDEARKVAEAEGVALNQRSMSPWRRSSRRCARRTISPNAQRAPTSWRCSTSSTGRAPDNRPSKAAGCVMGCRTGTSAKPTHLTHFDLQL